MEDLVVQVDVQVTTSSASTGVSSSQTRSVYFAPSTAQHERSRVQLQLQPSELSAPPIPVYAGPAEPAESAAAIILSDSEDEAASAPHPPPAASGALSRARSPDQLTGQPDSPRKRPKLQLAVSLAPAEEEEGEDCIICMESITAEGEHRACCLKCGHIFGHNCILKWLASADRDRRCCPQCKEPSRTHDVRVLFCKRTLQVTDNSELTQLRKDYASVKIQLKTLEEENHFCKLRVKDSQELIQRLTREKSDLERVMASNRLQQSADASAVPSPFPSSSVPRSLFVLKHVVDYTPQNTARVMAHYPYMNLLLVSQRVSAFGPFKDSSALRLISTEDFRSELFAVPCGTIRDLAVNNAAGTVLIASADNKLSVYSLSNKTVVHQYRDEAPVWCCSWNNEDGRYLYAGLQNGAISVFDLRNLSQRLTTLLEHGRPNRTPIIQMQHVERRPGHAFPLGGLLFSSLDQCGFYTSKEPGMQSSQFSSLLQGGGHYAMTYERAGRLVANSFRPDKKYPHVRHRVSELLYQADANTATSQVSLGEIQEITGGKSNVGMLRSCFVPVEEGSQCLLAVGDEASKAIRIGGLVERRIQQEIRLAGVPLDILSWQAPNSPERLLAVTTEKSLYAYTLAPKDA